MQSGTLLYLGPSAEQKSAIEVSSDPAFLWREEWKITEEESQVTGKHAPGAVLVTH